MPEVRQVPEKPEEGEVADKRGFLRQRWRGRAPLRTLFWRDMLGVGTVINLAFSLAGLLLAAQGQPLSWAVAVHFAPTPWNAFLVSAVWRTPSATWLLRVAALAWLGAMLVL